VVAIQNEIEPGMIVEAAVPAVASDSSSIDESRAEAHPEAHPEA